MSKPIFNIPINLIKKESESNPEILNKKISIEKNRVCFIVKNININKRDEITNIKLNVKKNIGKKKKQ